MAQKYCKWGRCDVGAQASVWTFGFIHDRPCRPPAHALYFVHSWRCWHMAESIPVWGIKISWFTEGKETQWMKISVPYRARIGRTYRSARLQHGFLASLANPCSQDGHLRASAPIFHVVTISYFEYQGYHHNVPIGWPHFAIAPSCGSSTWVCPRSVPSTQRHAGPNTMFHLCG